MSKIDFSFSWEIFLKWIFSDYFWHIHSTFGSYIDNETWKIVSFSWFYEMALRAVHVIQIFRHFWAPEVSKEIRYWRQIQNPANKGNTDRTLIYHHSFIGNFLATSTTLSIFKVGKLLALFMRIFYQSQIFLWRVGDKWIKWLSIGSFVSFKKTTYFGIWRLNKLTYHQIGDSSSLRVSSLISHYIWVFFSEFLEHLRASNLSFSSIIKLEVLILVEHYRTDLDMFVRTWTKEHWTSNAIDTMFDLSVLEQLDYWSFDNSWALSSNIESKQLLKLEHIWWCLSELKFHWIWISSTFNFEHIKEFKENEFGNEFVEFSLECFGCFRFCKVWVSSKMQTVKFEFHWVWNLSCKTHRVFEFREARSSTNIWHEHLSHFRP